MFLFLSLLLIRLTSSDEYDYYINNEVYQSENCTKENPCGDLFALLEKIEENPSKYKGRKIYVYGSLNLLNGIYKFDQCFRYDASLYESYEITFDPKTITKLSDWSGINPYHTIYSMCVSF